MIQTTELRIGNKVVIKMSDRINTVEELSPGAVRLEGWQGWISYKRIYGMELTPEILQACGFEKKRFDCEPEENDPAYQGWDFRLELPAGGCSIILSRFDDFDKSGGNLLIEVGEESAGTNHEIKFLHQLQNLFFALTGTELTVNLEQVTP